ncbi:MAG: peptidoglycan DD-metalloendopeptidase family protein [Bacteroidales bacterium]|jgi:murein DD-endopeptidase MepM/ murein hydrolase activator NlpD|nr:peptidoglycan DD-metalloendopeptidase family protein [Bacteroidales bacterium]
MLKYTVSLFLLGFIILFISCNSPSKKAEVAIEEIELPKPVLLFDIPIDSFLIEKEKVKRNQNLSDILLKQNVSYARIAQLVEIAKPICDVRKMKAGNNYYLFKDSDSLQRLRYFAYEKNRVEYVVFDLNDTIRATAGKKEINRVLDTIEGTVTSSMWNAMVDNNANPELANELSDIYSWTIDFFGIQKGDTYRIFYEQLVVDEDTFGIGKVFAARFNHLKTDYNAYYFVQPDSFPGSVGEYFDEEGKSLRKTFLKAPLKFKRVSSRFSNSRMHPILKIRRPHHGVDYAANSGTPVYTIGDGVVAKKAFQKNGGGNYITIKHNGTYSTTYMHLRGYAKGMYVGKTLQQSDLIGYVGQTGLASGPHLDFRVFKNGQAIDPLKMKSPSAKPVDSLYLEDFYRLRDSLNKVLYTK